MIAAGGLLAAVVFAWGRLRNAFPAGKGDLRRLEDQLKRLEDQLERMASDVNTNSDELHQLNGRVAKIEGWIDAQREYARCHRSTDR